MRTPTRRLITRPVHPLVELFSWCGQDDLPVGDTLVAALADPDRGWNAIVIGEHERAFYDSQYASMAPLFEHFGVTLWAPEVGGRIDWRCRELSR